jgi:hypothetical protein
VHTLHLKGVVEFDGLIGARKQLPMGRIESFELFLILQSIHQKLLLLSLLELLIDDTIESLFELH